MSESGRWCVRDASGAADPARPAGSHRVGDAMRTHTRPRC
jgi:hypothetical protein